MPILKKANFIEHFATVLGRLEALHDHGLPHNWPDFSLEQVYDYDARAADWLGNLDVIQTTSRAWRRETACEYSRFLAPTKKHNNAPDLLAGYAIEAHEHHKKSCLSCLLFDTWNELESPVIYAQTVALCSGAKSLTGVVPSRSEQVLFAAGAETFNRSSLFAMCKKGGVPETAPARVQDLIMLGRMEDPEWRAALLAMFVSFSFNDKGILEDEENKKTFEEIERECRENITDYLLGC